MLEKTLGIIFHHVKFSDTSIIAKIYTQQFGLQSYLVKGLRNRRSATKKALFQHLNLVEIVVSHREKKEIQHLKEIRIYQPFHTIPYDINKTSVALFLNEVLYQVIREEEANPELFRFLWEWIEDLDRSDQNISSFHLAFLIQLSRYLGFFPKNNYSESACCFNLTEGCFGPESIPGDMMISSPYSSYISQLSSQSAYLPAELVISSPHKPILLEIILKYYQYHLPGIREFKSHAVLHDVLK
jgi:DNA repair protein RecO (recombination protein O)